MDGLVLVGVGHGLGDLRREREHFLDLQPSCLLLHEAKRAALEQLHHDEEQAVLNAGADHLDDVRVTDAAEKLRLGLAALHHFRRHAARPIQDLQGEILVEKLVVHAEDAGMPALADEREDTVTSEVATDLQWRLGQALVHPVRRHLTRPWRGTRRRQARASHAGKSAENVSLETPKQGGES